MRLLPGCAIVLAIAAIASRAWADSCDADVALASRLARQEVTLADDLTLSALVTRVGEQAGCAVRVSPDLLPVSMRKHLESLVACRGRRSAALSLLTRLVDDASGGDLRVDVVDGAIALSPSSDAPVLCTRAYPGGARAEAMLDSIQAHLQAEDPALAAAIELATPEEGVLLVTAPATILARIESMAATIRQATSMTYAVSAVVSGLDGELLRPTLLVSDGQEGTIRVGTEEEAMFSLRVSVTRAPGDGSLVVRFGAQAMSNGIEGSSSLPPQGGTMSVSIDGTWSIELSIGSEAGATTDAETKPTAAPGG